MEGISFLSDGEIPTDVGGTSLITMGRSGGKVISRLSLSGGPQRVIYATGTVSREWHLSYKQQLTNLLFDSCRKVKNKTDWMNKYTDLFPSSPSFSFFFLFSHAYSSTPWPIAFPHSARTIGWVMLSSFCLCHALLNGAVRASCYTASSVAMNSEQWEGNGHNQSLGTTSGGLREGPPRNSESRPKSSQTQPDCENC